MKCPTTPESKLSGLGYFRFARRYSGNRILLYLPPDTEMFQFPGLPYITYEFSYIHYSITNSRLPYSEIPGSKLTYSSPRHIGVSPVLHRLLVPRHSPCALLHLTNLYYYAFAHVFIDVVV